jgi:NAD(P)-dependent dehydrogenase (short-subunit alcohol dehydrogenase family)
VVNDVSVEGRAVIVTGAGNGIGAAVAKYLAARGAKVVINDLGSDTRGIGASESNSTSTGDAIRQAGGEAVVNGGDVTDPITGKRLVEQALDEFGRLDGVVNSAGILRDGIFHKLPPEDWHAVLNVHLNGTFNVSHAAAAHFRQAGTGSFVHMTSTSGLIGALGQANYSAAKAGIVGLSRSIAIDMANFGVRSNAVAPFAWSRLTATVGSDNDSDARRTRIFKLLDPGTIAPLVMYLLSDAAHEVTGQIFAVRGNEIFLMSQIRAVRSAHSADGWNPDLIASRVAPAFRSSLTPLETSAQVFSWDPI